MNFVAWGVPSFGHLCAVYSAKARFFSLAPFLRASPPTLCRAAAMSLGPLQPESQAQLGIIPRACFHIFDLLGTQQTTTLSEVPHKSSILLGTDAADGQHALLRADNFLTNLKALPTLRVRIAVLWPFQKQRSPYVAILRRLMEKRMKMKN
eukprot:5083693-Pleurochrysis_carterae.AAC.1